MSSYRALSKSITTLDFECMNPSTKTAASVTIELETFDIAEIKKQLKSAQTQKKSELLLVLDAIDNHGDDHKLDERRAISFRSGGTCQLYVELMENKMDTQFAIVDMERFIRIYNSVREDQSQHCRVILLTVLILSALSALLPLFKS